MKLDDLVGQFEKYTKMAKSDDPLLELEIDKVKTALANGKVPAEDIAVLESLIRNPASGEWKPGPALPNTPMLDYEPREEELEFFRNLIRIVRDGATWGNSAGHVYRIDKAKKQFVLTQDVEHDPDRWSEKTKMCLALLGWSVIDSSEGVKNLVCLKGKWSLGIFDYAIDTQENPKTPGQNFPKGTRGQDAVATSAFLSVGMVRLGRHTAYTMWQKLNTLTMPTGTGKTSAPWTR